MYFKLTKRNPYRDLIRNSLTIAKANISDSEKHKEYNLLYSLLADRLQENESQLNSSPAFAKRCEFWGTNEDIKSIKPVTNTKNPWLSFKRVLQNNLNSSDLVLLVSKELGWFNHTNYKDDWLPG